MKDLAYQVERAGEPVAGVTRDRHSPRQLRKAEFLGEALGEPGLGEVVGEKAVILRRQRAGVVVEACG